ETVSSRCCELSCAKRNGARRTARTNRRRRCDMLQITLPAEAAISAGSAAFERDELFIFLLASLPFQKVVIPAAVPVGIFVADAGPRLVDRAAPFFLVQEHADRAVDVVLLMTQHLLVLHDLREALARRLDVDLVMLRQPVEVALVDDDPVVTAAV